MKRAMKRHESGEARVIPIILRPVDWKDASFGTLQALPTNAEPIVSKKWGCTDEAFVDVARGLRVALGSLNPIINTDQKTKPIAKSPRVIIVDQMHRGDYTTINAAIAAAAPGSRISITPGVYDEGLIIDKPLEIVGDGNLGNVVIRASGKNTILFKTVRGKISNLLIRQNGGGSGFGVDITQGCLELDGCDITSDSLACIAVHGNAYPRIFGNKIHDGKSTGIFVYENGQGVIEDNEIYGNALSGVQIQEGGNPILKRNKIHDGKSAGIFVYENGQGVIEDNEIYGNAFSGIGIREAGNPTVRGNKIHDGKAGGILVHENGQGMIEDNDIFGNAFPGIEIREASNPTVRGNRINRNVYQAVYIHDKGAGIIENNDLRDNGKGAWFISDDCKNLVKRSGNQE